MCMYDILALLDAVLDTFIIVDLIHAGVLFAVTNFRMLWAECKYEKTLEENGVDVNKICTDHSEKEKD